MTEETAKSSGELSAPEQFHTPTEDNDYLGFWPDPEGVGFVSEVNGLDAREFSEYSPSRYELLQLARHWYKIYLDDAIFYLYSATSCSFGDRLSAYARRRVARIVRTIGDDAVDEVIESLNQEARKRIGEDHWRIFVSGDEAEREKLVEEAHGS